MTYSQPQYHRRSIRLSTYDYAQAGACFVTIVCRDRTLLLEDPRFREVVEGTWLWLADQYEFVRLDEFVVMPNHLHGIIVIGDARRGGSRTAPVIEGRRKPLGRLVGAFKTVSTKRINGIRSTPGLPVWQRNYYERVIRDDEELNRIRQYIVDNPAHWEEDRENPNNVGAVRERPLRDSGVTWRAASARPRRSWTPSGGALRPPAVRASPGPSPADSSTKFAQSCPNCPNPLDLRLPFG